ncbi:hypothetical protein ANN_12638 [Periplaneta americana]|uniref:Uncharacterized protein n=1 Tax=Periplaneta americana TaxID=6978 RepID=A0ABQ8TJN3_PERAM|nr:hypothetical protein ANN_12638 [Periplaneta americana]
MTPLCTLLKSGSDVLVQTFTVLVYRPSFLGYGRFQNTDKIVVPNLGFQIAIEISYSFVFRDLRNPFHAVAYIDMLQNFLFPQMQQMEMELQIIFQQDGAPSHFANHVREELNHRFPDRWIGRNGPIPWKQILTCLFLFIAKCYYVLNNISFATPCYNIHVELTTLDCKCKYCKLSRKKAKIDRWIDRGGPTPWPARCPNLNSLHFWL